MKIVMIASAMLDEQEGDLRVLFSWEPETWDPHLTETDASECD
jgi:hypothetical protein